MRTLYIVGWFWVALAGLVLYRTSQFPPEMLPPIEVMQPSPLEPVAAEPGLVPPPTSWFERVRAHCNPVEVEVALAGNPPPADFEGQAYAAACYALAGKIERAAERIDALPADQREGAANVVFDVGHPVADAGDDDAAGPIMQLVVEYSPDNYMALYHAGIAQAHLGEDGPARANLLRFLELYPVDDGWTGSARATLESLGERPGG